MAARWRMRPTISFVQHSAVSRRAGVAWPRPFAPDLRCWAGSSCRLRPVSQCASRRLSTNDPPGHEHSVRVDAPGAGKRCGKLACRPAGCDRVHLAITEAELRYSVALMPPGKRRSVLAAVIEDMLGEDFTSRILPFDSPAAVAFAEIAANRRQAGRPITQPDAQIAGGS